MTRLQSLLCAIVAIHFAAAAAATNPPAWTFKKIASSTTTLPAPASDKAWSFGSPAVDRGSIAFTAKHLTQSPPAFWGGVYLWTGSNFQVIADNRTTKPNGGLFTTIYWDGYGDLSLSSNNVAFPTGEGSFASISGALVELRDPSFKFDRLHVQGDAVYGVKVSLSFGSRIFGLARYQNGAFSDITPLRDGDMFMDTPVSVEYGMISAFGDRYASSAYIFDPATSTTINRWLALLIHQDATTTPAGVFETGQAAGDGPFLGNLISYDGEAVSALRYDNNAIVEYTSSGSSVLVDTTTAVPGRSVKFDRFVVLSRAKGATAYVAAFPGAEGQLRGVFLARGDRIEEIAASDKLLDGQIFESFRMGLYSFDGASIAFIAQSGVYPYAQTLYLATPTPPTIKVARQSDTLRVTWPAAPGAVYSVQTATELRPDATWQELANRVAPSTAEAFFEVTPTATMFLRVVRLP